MHNIYSVNSHKLNDCEYTVISMVLDCEHRSYLKDCKLIFVFCFFFVFTFHKDIGPGPQLIPF